MVTKKTNSIDTNIYLAAAEKLGYTTTILSAANSYASISNASKEIFIYENCLSINDQVSALFSKDKFLSNSVLFQVIPELIPETVQLLSDQPDAISRGVAFAESQQFSVVIKPNSASLGIGVSLLPKNSEEVTHIITSLFKEYTSVLVQQFLSAKKEYRIVYAEGEFYDAVERIPAYVIGDGVHTIEELITTKNKTRDEFDFPRLQIDDALKNLLTEKQLKLQSVLAENERIQLKNVCTFAQGGETKRVQQTEFHPDLLAAFGKVVKTSRLRFIGIDLMCDEISQPISGQSVGINEINSAPMADLHYFADLQENLDLTSTQKFLQRVLG